MTGIPALAGAAGLVLFAFGLLAALASFFQPATATSWTWVLGNLALGLALMIGAGFGSIETLRDRMRSGEARRVGKYGTSALLTAVLGVVVLGLLAFLSTRYTLRFDWTEQKVHTLSDQTRTVLEQLDTDVRITAFFNPLDAPPYRDLLDRYDYSSDRVSLTFADPNVRPDLVDELALDGSDLARGLMRIEAGGDSVDLTEFDEPSITNAIVKLTRGGGKKVVFLEGHNERSIEAGPQEDGRGFGRARSALENENYEVDTLLLAATGEVPEDADLVVVAGPTRPLLPEEHTALGRYLDRHPGNVSAQLIRAVLYQALRQPADARRALGAALELVVPPAYAHYLDARLVRLRDGHRLAAGRQHRLVGLQGGRVFNDLR